MSEELKLAQAKEAYSVICGTLDARGWKYKRDEEKYLVYFGVNGDDLPMDFIIRADPDRQLIRLHSLLGFKMNEDKRLEGAVAACAINYKLADGCFEYEFGTGSIIFKMTATYRDSQISEKLLTYMIDCSCTMVDMYNDKFMAINKGYLSISDFLAQNN